jgi:ribosome-associated protein
MNLEKQFDEVSMEIASVLDSKKAEDILLIDVSNATILAETFIICSGNSPTQLRMLADEVEKAMAAEQN